MSLSSAINAARSGLQVSSLRAEIVATNVSNVTTPGYVRRSVTISETVIGGKSAGVRSDGIGRVLDGAIKSQRRELTSDVAQASVLAATWKSISTRIGDTADGNGLFKTFSDFETALSRAATTPESNSNAAALLQAARNITDELNGLSDMVSTQRAEADREIADGVEVVNSALKQIEDLNTRLSSVNRTSSEAAALMDERQRVLDTIAEYLPIQTVERDHGKIDVLTTEGVFLVAGSAREIQFAPSSDFGPNRTLANGDLSGLTVDGVALTPGAASFGAVSGGLFGALFTLRDQDLPALSAQLDTIASQLVSRLSDDTIDPTKTPGDPGLFIDTDTAGGAGVAGRISINAAVDPEQGGAVWRLRDGLGAATPGSPGNQSILKGLFDAFTAVQTVSANGFQGAYSATEMAAQISSLAGQARVYNESVLSSTQTQYGILVEAEQSETGVDIDAQLQELMLVEQAYAANARVIEIASQMIKTLMEL
ncbi:MAG: flagellar hook-associated protein FlgK [Hyphomonas sp.]|uniref:flagellar hook-associated protein FlgK n=1 Tax=Hyphomonas sp. TaxID=87 RepID=UPI00181052BB|nr:flagellar hook-associated protein FlgK [Hyphomonas sp.]MBA3067870.1 flagellar hook-associated protein FlgK [Hyphomonas sp.]MBU3919048.1 flagellar hook-associated protein FlgK [Alphaproteobacteria bacterium]MBU4062426.1 flagellar hook-associated protein FlgK [Alphaproteobacteria bacterium]MBU4165965.1 flagellar hook-associated protein FlgK [Alphaproteobacteria bacterium]